MKNFSNYITGIIFSRDRALQLDATLRSFLLHCQDNQQSNVHVIFQTSEALHDKQYRQLIQEYGNYRNIFFHPETRFRRDVLRWATAEGGAGLVDLPVPTNCAAGYALRVAQPAPVEIQPASNQQPGAIYPFPGR